MKEPVIRRFRLPGGREIVSLRPDVHERALAKANETLARLEARRDELVDKAHARPAVVGESGVMAEELDHLAKLRAELDGLIRLFEELAEFVSGMTDEEFREAMAGVKRRMAN